MICATNRKRSLLSHDSEDLKQHIGSSPRMKLSLASVWEEKKRELCLHSSQLRISIICRCDLDNIGTNEVNSIKTTNDGSQLTSRPTASLGGTSCGRDYFNSSVAVCGSNKPTHLG